LRHKPEHFHITKLKRTYNRATNTFTFNISYETAVTTQTPRTRTIAENFGLGTDSAQRFTLYDNIKPRIRPTDIVLITGDSGSGKSALLKAIKTDLGTAAQDTKDLQINPNTPIIETTGKNTTQALQTLSKAGLNDAFLFLRNYNQLSDGQKHRYQIARLTETPAQWWILDEFCSTLDRDTARIVAFNLQKLARAQGKAVIAATTHNDLLKDLAPNVHIHKRYGKQVTIRYSHQPPPTACSLTREMHITQGTLTDYKQLSQFHYRTNTCPAPRKIFTLKRKNETCGTIIYSHPPPMCFGRSKTWKGTLQQLQQQISTITRVVIHPKYRSIGLGAKLVHETLTLAGTPYVETVAVMARINPFFEHAGMNRITESKPSTAVIEALEQLNKLGFDSALLADTNYSEHIINKVGCEAVTTVLSELSTHDAAVRRRLAGLRNIYPKHEEFTAKIATLNACELAKVLKRLSFLAQVKVYLFWSKEQQNNMN
jgi:ABC-type lipoprotein export system ATPase subunit/GNAT superfamily N-acetyltransferase